mmetsp:Transcript_18601/g.36951  ORF Transcript_18601/g.36951 Transcript_18601/m.36951 type:complete len:115 (+) Transcript_18601:817-1161(+)
MVLPALLKPADPPTPILASTQSGLVLAIAGYRLVLISEGSSNIKAAFWRDFLDFLFTDTMGNPKFLGRHAKNTKATSHRPQQSTEGGLCEEVLKRNKYWLQELCHALSKWEVVN